MTNISNLIERLHEEHNVLAEEAATALQEMQKEIELLTKSGIIEVAVRNPSVMDYMKHWEGRAETAEARETELVEMLRLADESRVSQIKRAVAAEKAFVECHESNMELEAKIKTLEDDLDSRY